MRTVIVKKEYENQRIDTFLMNTFRNMPSDSMYKAFRKRDIKVNGVRVKASFRLMSGDSIEIYLKDEIIDGK